MLLTDTSFEARRLVPPGFSVLRIVRRCFAKVAAFKDEWAFNLIIFDFEASTVDQHCIPANVQTAAFTDFVYDDNLYRLTFVVKGKIEEFPIYEISEALADNLLKPHNWNALAKGLKKQSPITAKWLTDRGIYGTNEPSRPRRGRTVGRR